MTRKTRYTTRPLHHNIGSVSSGTMRPEDLIPSFLWELKRQRPLKREHGKLCTAIRRRIDYDAKHGIGYWSTDAPGEASGIHAQDDLASLYDALDAYSPPYFYFGAHPGDGSDYGWWLSEGFEKEFDGLRVSDTSEVPKGYRGEVLFVSDHGNMTLYVANGRGGLREVWGIV